MADAQQTTEQNLQAFQRSTEEQLKALAEAQRHTDENLNALIAVVNGVVRRLRPRE
jgi:hypothetical protein